MMSLPRIGLLLGLLALPAAASPVSYQVAVNTTSALGVVGDLAFQFVPGGATGFQSATATIALFLSDGHTTSALPASINNNFGLAITGFTYGTFLQFVVSFNGPALSSPGGATTGSTFSLSLLDNTMTPLPITDANGNFVTVDVNLDGSTTATATSTAATISVATPEPSAAMLAALGLLGGAVGIRRAFGGAGIPSSATRAL